MVSCAKNGRVFSFANNILQVAFKAPFLADRMNKDDYRKAFEEILLRLARREIRLEAVIEGKAKLPQKPVKQQEVQQSPESETQICRQRSCRKTCARPLMLWAAA